MLVEVFLLYSVVVVVVLYLFKENFVIGIRWLGFMDQQFQAGLGYLIFFNKKRSWFVDSVIYRYIDIKGY